MKYKMTNFYIVNEEESTARCSCGLTFLDKRIGEGFHNIKCPNCGTYEVKEVPKSTYGRPRVQRGVEFIKCTEESQQKIVFTKYKPTRRWKMDKESGKPVFEPVVDEKVGEWVIDFKNKDFHLSNLKEDNISITRNGIISFFGSTYKVYDAKRMVSLQTNKNLFSSIGYVDLHCKGGFWSSELDYNGVDGIVKFLTKFDQYEELQVLANCGCPTALLKNVAVELGRDENTIKRFHSDSWYYSTQKDKSTFKIDFSQKSPAKFLGIKPFVLNRAIKDTSINGKSDFCKHLIEENEFAETFGKDKWQFVLNLCSEVYTKPSEVFTNGILTKLNKLIKKGYNFDTLIKYAVDLCKNRQGIPQPEDALNLLVDTIIMSEKMGLPMFEKYPKSLKREHDLYVMNYEIYEDNKKKKGYENATMKEDYVRKEVKKAGKDRITLEIPKTVESLYHSAETLRNCLKSYVDRIGNGSSQIFIIKEYGVEVGAVEVANNRVNQAYFIGNEPLKQNHKDFLKKWCNKYGVEPNHQITTE